MLSVSLGAVVIVLIASAFDEAKEHRRAFMPRFSRRNPSLGFARDSDWRRALVLEQKEKEEKRVA
jgi:hypothetical protein